MELAEKGQLMTRKEGECRLLRKQLEEMVRECEETVARGKQWETERQMLTRERQSLEVLHTVFRDLEKRLNAPSRSTRRSAADESKNYCRNWSEPTKSIRVLM
jgi:BMFP domain-containing protein YqiC